MLSFDRRSPVVEKTKKRKIKKRTLLRLDGGLDGRDGGVGAELERERAVCCGWVSGRLKGRGGE